MFFIGIFGINQSEKLMDTYNNAICPSCGGFSRFEIFKTYSYFHIFFMPVFKWNTRYFVKTACCNSIYELDPYIGKQYDKGHNPEITNEHLKPLNTYSPYKTCPNCRANIESNYSFCPYCGTKMSSNI